LFGQLPYDLIALGAIAEEAGTTVQTVLRHFGSKESLFVEVSEARGRLIREARNQAKPGNVEEAVRNVVESYEKWGDVILHLLGQEQRVAEVRRGVEKGRRYHQAWVRRIFEPLLGELSSSARELLLAQLVVATDIYSWKILRRDLGLSMTMTRRTLVHIVTAILGRPQSDVGPRSRIDASPLIPDP
jgi:AcrR family transcriptional regulator